MESKEMGSAYELMGDARYWGFVVFQGGQTPARSLG